MAAEMKQSSEAETKALGTLLALLRLALSTDGSAVSATAARDLPTGRDDAAWKDIYRMAVAQGVSGIALEGLQRLPEELRPERRLLIQWGITVKTHEQVYDRQAEAACRLAEAFHSEGIDTMVLKGIGLSQYYPYPRHRECSDIDLYLYGEHTRGNAIAARLGGKVEEFSRKHDHISFGGFNVDNHIDFLPVNSPAKRELNNSLLELLEGQPRERIGQTWLIQAPRDFNYVFLVRHAYTHFLIEGIALRHVLDFACFLGKEQGAIDWPRVNGVLAAAGLRKFSQVLLRLVDAYFGLKTGDGKPLPQSLLRHLEADMLHEDHRVVYGKTVWQRAKVSLHNRWKYDAFHEGGFLGYLWERFVSGRLGGRKKTE